MGGGLICFYLVFRVAIDRRIVRCEEGMEEAGEDTPCFIFPKERKDSSGSLPEIVVFLCKVLGEFLLSCGSEFVKCMFYLVCDAVECTSVRGL